MQRLGPLYPAALALAQLSALPLAAELSPRREDLPRSAPWFPLVGALLGAGMSALALLLAALGLVPAVAAALAVALGLALTGGALERDAAALVVALGRGARDGGRAALDQSADARARAVAAAAVAATGAVAVRALLVIGIAPDRWLAALVLAAAAARAWPLVWAHLAPSLRFSDDSPNALAPALLPSADTPPGAVIASAVVLIAALWLAGLTGLWAAVLGAGVYALAARALSAALARAAAAAGSDRDAAASARRVPASAALLCELSVLLWLALAHPATASPWLTLAAPL
ncbi:cobalamin synthase [Haliangium ochraceum DSM 14365]|uniref:Adenosylcobinamide-GDP ribazoletransferase n=2 Tax=Haliangium ochraceum TaxID=80816 RepID=D0LN80_HALO1|nr:cobalamin synthase [Haliangium ochraceum DSM 14365]